MSDIGWYVLYRDTTGDAVSVGTDDLSALPAGLSVARLDSDDAEALLSGDGRWDAATRAVVDVPSPLPESVDTVRLSAWLTARGYDATATIRDIEDLP